MTNSQPLVSVVLPAFNEAAIIRDHLEIVCDYLDSGEFGLPWEIVIVNDGSADKTGRIAEEFAGGRENVSVVHHKRNYGLGQALKFGVGQTKGDYVVTMDIDLSYSADHIGRLVQELRQTNAKLVLASPYMEGGSISNVPWLRKFLSVWANRFLALVASGNLSTLTCMVRGYNGEFARSLVLRAVGMEVMPETVYKSMILRAGIEQIPAHLDWGLQQKQKSRRSSMRIMRHMLATMLSGFVFRPFMFFIVPGLILLAFSVWVNAWMIIHFFEALQAVPADPGMDRISIAISTAYRDFPHTFIVGLLTLMVAIQLISLGILALQSKAYFEEVYYLGTTIRKASDKGRSAR